MLDIDHFKLVNDRFGHQRGDEVLVEFRNRVTGSVRDIDTFARYGGEEFVLILPETNLEGGMRVAEHVREIVAASPVEADGDSIAVTLSVGVACHPEHGTTIPALTAAADAGLYVAKGAGKNQVQPAPAPTEHS